MNRRRTDSIRPCKPPDRRQPAGWNPYQSLPTTIVTVEPGGALEPPPGVWPRTIPFFFWPWTTLKVTATPKPADRRAPAAAACDNQTTPGTVPCLGEGEGLGLG